MQSNGNALFLILIAVALFAALSYAITNAGRGGSGIDREKISIETATVTQYGAALSTALNRMRIINDCDDADISFENPLTTHYTNPGSSDSCKVFHPDGGGMTAQAPPPAIWANRGTGFQREHYSFISGINIPNVGSDRNELMLSFQVEDEQTCRFINQNLNNSPTAPAATDFCTGPFTGSYESLAGCPNTTWTNVPGWQSGCVRQLPSSPDFFYFQVIAAR